jgi:hypothetical protein
MAACNHCHRDISPNAPVCPHCGEPDPVRASPAEFWCVIVGGGLVALLGLYLILKSKWWPPAGNFFLGGMVLVYVGGKGVLAALSKSPK